MSPIIPSYSTRKITALLAGCALAFACNLTAATTNATPAGKPMEIQNTVPAAKATADSSGWLVEILSPAPNAVVAVDAPLTVTARFSGGKAIEARLLADNQPVAGPIVDLEPNVEFSLVWQAPTGGQHELTIEVMDAEKQTHAASVPVIVNSADTAAATPTLEMKPAGNTIAFLSAADGATLHATVDANGIPYVSVEVEASGSGIKDIILDADGLQMARAHNDAYTSPFRAMLTWSPLRGNGKYALTVYARTAEDHENHFQPLANAAIQVDVDGVLPGVKTIRQRMIDLFAERFGQIVPIPPVARYMKPISSARDDSRWVSAVYLGDYLYEIDIFDNASVTASKKPLNHQEIGVFDSVCRPMGDWKVLVVVADYGNTGIAKDQAFASIHEAEARANRWHQDFASAHSLAAPLVQFHATPVYLGRPPRSADTASAAEILAATGYRTSDYDITAEVDLDTTHAVGERIGGVGLTFYGGCRAGGSQHVNFYMTIDNADTMTGALATSLFDHELSHVLGWMHWWPTGSGSAADEMVWNNTDSCMASLFFGWTDIDGDGIIEILDPTPYGR